VRAARYLQSKDQKNPQPAERKSPALPRLPYPGHHARTNDVNATMTRLFFANWQVVDQKSRPPSIMMRYWSNAPVADHRKKTSHSEHSANQPFGHEQYTNPQLAQRQISLGLKTYVTRIDGSRTEFFKITSEPKDGVLPSNEP
jgi:hypothetical protein